MFKIAPLAIMVIAFLSCRFSTDDHIRTLEEVHEQRSGKYDTQILFSVVQDVVCSVRDKAGG